MRSSDWQPMTTAPLNPYGQPFGPTVLIWCDADKTPWPAYYDPRYAWKHDNPGPAWVVLDSNEEPVHPDNAIAWMAIAAPRPTPTDEAP